MRTWLTTVAVTLLLSSCSLPAGPPDETGVSDAMLADSAQYQRPLGLFAMPESSARSTFDFQPTARYLAALGPADLDVLDWPTLSMLDVPDSLDLAQLDAYLQVAHVSGDRRFDDASLRKLSDALVLPPAAADPGVEIGVLWTWSNARLLLNSMGGNVPSSPAAAERTSAINLNMISSHPYLIHRLGEVYSQLDLPRPAGLTDLGAGVAQAELPTPDSLINVLDAVAVLRQRESTRYTAEVPAAYIEEVARVLTTEAMHEDLAIAGLLEILGYSGRPPIYRDYLAGLRSRVSPSTGLLTDASLEIGSVEATYLFARLLDARFQEIASRPTLDRLRVAAAEPDRPLASRLAAVVALRRGGDEQWSVLATAALDELSDPPLEVGQDALAEYLDVMEPAVQLDPDVERSALIPFIPGPDEGEQRKAAAALAHSYLFSNEESVGSMFPELQQLLKSWLDSSSTPFPQLVAAAATLPSSRIIQLDPSYLERTGARIAERRGCAGAATFFSVDGAPNGLCSVVLTLQARGVPASQN